MPLSTDKKVLITGAVRFLGSHLADRFINEGFRVIGMDNFVTGDPKNIVHFSSNPNSGFIEHDVTQFVKMDGQPKVTRHMGLKKTFEYFKGLSEEELYKSEYKDISKHIRR